MVNIIMENIKIILEMEMDYICIIIKIDILDNGKKTKKTEKVLIYLLIQTKNLQEIGMIIILLKVNGLFLKKYIMMDISKGIFLKVKVPGL